MNFILLFFAILAVVVRLSNAICALDTTTGTKVELKSDEEFSEAIDKAGLG